MMHTSRLSEEIIMWTTSEFGFIQLPDEYTTGSSIMPQKKNPDVAELCRGKTGRVFGNLMSLLTVLKGLPLAYNKDIQEDKEPLFDSVETVKLCIEAFIEMVDVMKVNEESMYESATKGYVNATDLADYLVVKGLPFRDAYRQVAASISEGTFEYEGKPHHTHEGSIGNLCNDKVAARMERIMSSFGFDKVAEALDALIK